MAEGDRARAVDAVECEERRQRLDDVAGRHRPVDDGARHDAVEAGRYRPPRHGRRGWRRRGGRASAGRAARSANGRGSNCGRRTRHRPRPGRPETAARPRSRDRGATDRPSGRRRGARRDWRRRCGRAARRPNERASPRWRALDEVVAARRSRNAARILGGLRDRGRRSAGSRPCRPRGQPTSVSQMGFDRGTQAVGEPSSTPPTRSNGRCSTSRNVLLAEHPGLAEAPSVIGVRRLRGAVGIAGVVPVIALAARTLPAR